MIIASVATAIAARGAASRQERGERRTDRPILGRQTEQVDETRTRKAPAGGERERRIEGRLRHPDLRVGGRNAALGRGHIRTAFEQRRWHTRRNVREIPLLRHRDDRQSRDQTARRAAAARPAPGVLDAIAHADAVVICPANPILSIAPILAVELMFLAANMMKLIEGGSLGEHAAAYPAKPRAAVQLVAVAARAVRPGG